MAEVPRNPRYFPLFAPLEELNYTPDQQVPPDVFGAGAAPSTTPGMPMAPVSPMLLDPPEYARGPDSPGPIARLKSMLNSVPPQDLARILAAWGQGVTQGPQAVEQVHQERERRSQTDDMKRMQFEATQEDRRRRDEDRDLQRKAVADRDFERRAEALRQQISGTGAWSEWAREEGDITPENIDKARTFYAGKREKFEYRKRKADFFAGVLKGGVPRRLPEEFASDPEAVSEFEEINETVRRTADMKDQLNKSLLAARLRVQKKIDEADTPDEKFRRQVQLRSLDSLLRRMSLRERLSAKPENFGYDPFMMAASYEAELQDAMDEADRLYVELIGEAGGGPPAKQRPSGRVVEAPAPGAPRPAPGPDKEDAAIQDFMKMLARPKKKR